MADQERKIAQLIEITGVTNAQAVNVLQATNWVVEEAVNLFFSVGLDGISSAESGPAVTVQGAQPVTTQGPVWPGIRRRSLAHYAPNMAPTTAAAMAAYRERSVGRDAPREARRTHHGGGDIPLRFLGTFHDAKVDGKIKEKWLLANIQPDVAQSHRFNNKIRQNAEIKEILREHFIYWQTYNFEDVRKISSWYKTDQQTALLIIDPYTGYNMHKVEGTVNVEQMIEILRPFTEKGPVDEFKKCLEDRNNSEEVVRTEYPALPPEPAISTPGVVNIAIRLPYEGRIERRFLATDPIQVIWSFAATQIPEGKHFELVCFTGGLKLNYDEKKTIQEAGVADSLLTLFYSK